jgi:uncharacterized protein YcbK (DUF882 family)
VAYQRPPADLIERNRRAIHAFLVRVNAVGQGFPDGRITSWYRDPWHNRSVGGAASSQHLTATALDVVVPRARVAALVREARWAGLTAIDEGDHVHLQLFPAGVRTRRD